MRKVWAVSEGSYSDYGVKAIFAREADAEEWATLSKHPRSFDDPFVESFVFFDEGEMPELVRFVQLNAVVGEDGSVTESNTNPYWRTEWTVGFGTAPPAGRAVGRTWSAPAWGKGLAVMVKARTEELARKAFHDRVTQAKTMVPVPPGMKVNEDDDE